MQARLGKGISQDLIGSFASYISKVILEKRGVDSLLKLPRKITTSEF